jgi:hypothetical protein
MLQSVLRHDAAAVARFTNMEAFCVATKGFLMRVDGTLETEPSAGERKNGINIDDNPGAH